MNRPAWSKLILLGLILLVHVGRAPGQAMIRNPTQPILVYQNQGHAGPVRSIIFDPRSGHLLTGGHDKVINVWDSSNGQLRLLRTIRPPIWRGPNGSIFSMALSPIRDEQGEAVLAVAGHGVQSSFGNISLFQFPGHSNLKTGNLTGQLNGFQPEKPDEGHFRQVNILLYHPQGRYLASGGEDGTVRLWNMDTRQQFAKLEREARDPVTALAFDREGNQLWASTVTGVITQWDLTDLANPRQVRNSGAVLQEGVDAVRPGDLAINAMVLAPDASWMIVGLESGRLLRVDTATLEGVTPLPGSGERGPIEALAISPDGAHLAASVIHNRYRSEGNQTPPRTDSDIELRSSVNGEVVSTLHRTKNRVHCLTFSPDGKSLAFAGDNSQSVCLVPIDTKVLLRAQGQGSSLWDVGFLKDGTTLGLSRRRADEAGPPFIQGFDLKAREPQLVSRAEMLGELRSEGGWTVSALDELRLQVSKDNIHYPIPLRRSSIRWWDFTLIPEPNRAAGEPPIVVVGCETEVLVYAPTPPDPTTGARGYRLTRILNGHSSAVLGVAPSRDGRWLATCSDDQTVRLWSVDRWRETPRLGVKATPRDGKYFVDAVDPLGFGDAMGLKVGDGIVSVRLLLAGNQDFDGLKEYGLNEDLWRTCDSCESTTIEFAIDRAGKRIRALTTKRDSPTASLFLSENLEWVIWTPEGYYDTSIQGDRTFLGFHRNGSKADVLDLAEDTSYITIDQFEKELRRPKLFDQLIATGDRIASYNSIQRADTVELVIHKQPPAIKVSLPAHPLLQDDAPLIVDSPDLDINVQVLTKGFSAPVLGLKQLRLLVDTGIASIREFPQPAPVIPPGQSAEYPFKIRLKPGLQRVSAIAENTEGVKQPTILQVDFRPTAALPPKVRPPELYIAAFGTGEFARERFKPIPKVATDLADLTQHFANPDVQRYTKVDLRKPVGGTAATLDGLRGLILALEQEANLKHFGQGDTVILAIETHLVAIDEYHSLLVPFDADESKLEESCLSTKDVTERLRSLARKGCHVMVLLDVNHPNSVRKQRSLSPSKGLKEWARELHEADVMTFVAAIGGPSIQDNEGENGVFATAILGSVDRSNWKRKSSANDVMTLADFQEAVQSQVDTLTLSKQAARLYPANVPLEIPFLTPPSANLPLAATPRQ